MAKSMTAYGRSTLLLDDEAWILEIYSVNKRNLDIQVFLPKDYLFLDAELRKKMAKNITRGQVTIRIVRQANAKSTKLSKNLFKTLEDLKDKWTDAALRLNLDPQKEISLDFLLSHLGEQEIISDEARTSFTQSILEPLFKEALEKFEKMKESEGEALSSDISNRIKTLKKCLETVENECAHLPEKYKKKLHERLKSISDIEEEVQERAAKELSFQAEKMDVTEEIVRLRSHLTQMEQLLSSQEKSIGKPFDFLIQEAAREINTLGSKALELSTIRLTLEMKNELEKIREQIQNIE